ncbi:hypothetical protein C8R47DRAFT_1218566 [Mycena vitilis]|nr:hypothetical protein C8R47DRAFT_1218566 [Mycena vitilis]
MASISRRRTELLQSMEAHKAVLSPIRRIPPEILGEIFSFIVHATFHFNDINRVTLPVSRHAPWLLTRVCRHWAAVALETPALWSMVFLYLASLGEHGAVPMTELCLQRSRSMPLNVKFFCEGRLESHAVLNAAMSASNRWQHAYISILFPLAFQLRSIRGRLSALTTLNISIDLAAAGMAVDENDSIWSMFADAPQLTSLVTHSWDLDSFLRVPFTLPWHQLTRLSTTFTSNTEALSILRQLLEIVECKLTFDRNEVLQSDSMKTHLPSLRFLTVHIETEHPPQLIQLAHTSLLDFLSTPSLRYLETVDTANEESVLGLVTRSDCAASLKCLRFHSRWIDQTAVLHLMQRLPELTLVEIGDFDGDLLSQSAFVSSFSDQWERQQQYDVALPRRLSVRITDKKHLGSNQLTRQAGRLSFAVSRNSYFDSIIEVPFHLPEYLSL